MHATEDGNFSRLHFAWKRLKSAHFCGHSSKLTSKGPLKRVSCPVPAVRLHSVVVCEEERNAFSYRVQDFIEVYETDGDADDLEEDGCEGDEPQALQRR